MRAPMLCAALGMAAGGRVGGCIAGATSDASTSAAESGAPPPSSSCSGRDRASVSLVEPRSRKGRRSPYTARSIRAAACVWPSSRSRSLTRRATAPASAGPRSNHGTPSRHIRQTRCAEYLPASSPSIGLVASSIKTLIRKGDRAPGSRSAASSASTTAAVAATQRPASCASARHTPRISSASS